ncbi:hypothetical protein GCM10027047_07810 [Rhodococcus aerolatus]
MPVPPAWTCPELPADAAGRTVADLAITAPKTLPASATVADARDALRDGHVHLVLLVGDGVLRGTVDRADLEREVPPGSPALDVARLGARTVDAAAPVLDVHREMVAVGRRRLAVVDAERRLVGLLCLRADGRGFCTDAGVAAREAERAGG